MFKTPKFRAIPVLHCPQCGDMQVGDDQLQGHTCRYKQHKMNRAAQTENNISRRKARHATKFWEWAASYG